ncbi:MAG: hypothetical protein WBD22_02345 [Pyrinomonadaceae bacterium]
MLHSIKTGQHVDPSTSRSGDARAGTLALVTEAALLVDAALRIAGTVVDGLFFTEGRLLRMRDRYVELQDCGSEEHGGNRPIESRQHGKLLPRAKLHETVNRRAHLPPRAANGPRHGW